MGKRANAEAAAQAVAAWEKYGRNAAEASRKTGIAVTTIKDALRRAGIQPTRSVTPLPGVDDVVLRDEIKRLKKELILKRRGEDLILESVREALAEMPALRIATPLPARTGEEEIAVAVLSDTQIGKVTPTYDPSVCRERVQLFAQKIVKIAGLRRAHASLNRVRVWLIGDGVEGESIFPSQPWSVNCGVYQQACHIGPQIHAEFIITLAAFFPEVEVVCVPGNHGRPAHKGMAMHPATNWDRVCYEVTKHLVEKALPQRSIPFEIAQDWYTVAPVAGDWKALLIHGDQIEGGGNSGQFEKAALSWAEAIEEPWDYMVMGHFHKVVRWDVGHRVVYVNGTTESPDSDFVKARLKRYGVPSQRLFFANAEHGIIDEPVIKLVDTVPRQEAA